jgi:hypothetical protein
MTAANKFNLLKHFVSATATRCFFLSRVRNFSSYERAEICDGSDSLSKGEKLHHFHLDGASEPDLLLNLLIYIHFTTALALSLSSSLIDFSSAKPFFWMIGRQQREQHVKEQRGEKREREKYYRKLS